MSDSEIERAAEANSQRDYEDGIRAISLRRTGTPWGTIARQLGRSQIEIEELAKAGYKHLLGESDVDLLRAESEDRYEAIIRAANIDLGLAETVAERMATLRLLLAAEQARAKLLGLNLRGGE